MPFKQDYTKAERRAKRDESIKFAACTVTIFVRKESSMLGFRVRCCGKNSPFKSLGIKLKPSQFNSKTLHIAGDPYNTARVVDLKASILKVFKERELTGRSLDPTLIRDIALGLRGHDDYTPTIIEAITRWTEQKAKLLGNGLSLSSLKQYQRYGRIISEFVTINYGKDASLDTLKPAVQHDLLVYMKGDRKSGHNYAIKTIQFLKAILDYAVAYEWCDRNVLQSVRLNKQRKEVRTLTMVDLEKVKQTHFVETTLNEVRDIFLFCCYTGLAYTDVASLTKDYLITVDDIQCILKDRKKSGQQSFVPLFPEALAILDKYRYHPICRLKGVLLPVLSNQKMNKWLKVIGNVAGIKETLHTHLARKTFTMFADERGFKLDQTAIMMGHSHAYMTEQHYYKGRRETVIKEFKRIQNDQNQQAS
ncbi:site-specific integrase [Spirosoma endbachense]|uniref:Tyrosine-type recombinase/integrase n=1 Tax=Spirosoma endbachense TaxID=2666025 RepID=A0A6P1W416_9BACT|nr:site-specific integrase [Spirosoma endbachense]QHV99298.1 tyrosine-type recombinase/integrase [Spirosoma endbachense]